MKKVLLILLVILLAFTITACRGEAESEDLAVLGEEVEGQEATEGDETDPVNGAEQQDEDDPDRDGADREGTDREGTDREGTDREGTDGEGTDREGADRDRDDPDGEDESAGSQGGSPGDSDSSASEGRGDQSPEDPCRDLDPETRYFVDNLEEEFEDLIFAIEEELDRLIDALLESDGDDEWIDDQIDRLDMQFDHLMDDVEDQWFDLVELLENDSISPSEFETRAQGILGILRNFSFR